MSEHEAFVRIRAARLGRRFPVILRMLESNELHLTAIKLLGPHLSDSNHLQLLQRARHATRTELEKLVAELAPKPDVPSTMRKLPSNRPAARAPLPAQAKPDTTTRASEDLNANPANTLAPALPPSSCSTPPNTLADADGGSRSVAPAAGPADRHARRPQDFRLESSDSHTTVLSPGRYKVQFTASQRLHDKLEQLRDLMRHQVPDGDLAMLVERAADSLIAEQMRRRFGQVKRPRPRSESAATGAPRSRYVPRSLLRAVHARDGGRCTFVAADGRRCAARGMLELHHVHAFAKGGPTSLENLRVVCRAHNALFAEQEFGRRALGPERHQL